MILMKDITREITSTDKSEREYFLNESSKIPSPNPLTSDSRQSSVEMNSRKTSDEKSASLFIQKSDEEKYRKGVRI